MSDYVHMCSSCSDIVYILYDRPLGLDVLLMAFITSKLKADDSRFVIIKIEWM